MRESSGTGAGMWISTEPSLQALLGRLEALSLEPRFALQRERALASVVQPYRTSESARALAPLPEELALARLYVYADYLPSDGQSPLLEQVRDLIEVHVPEDERRWLDPLRRSYMDLLEVRATRPVGPATELTLRSLADGTSFRVGPVELDAPAHAGQVLLTRLIARDGESVLPGTAILLSADVAGSIFESVDQVRRETEVIAGSFALGEWAEYAKRFGQVLLWQVAQARFALLLEAERRMVYRTARGERFFPAAALYAHHEAGYLAGELRASPAWRAVPVPPHAEPGGDLHAVWERKEEDGERALEAEASVRLTLTSTQLWVESDTAERLEDVKHELAAAFGFSLHFRGEAFMPPAHAPPEPDLTTGPSESRHVDVSPEEEARLWSSFLESVYLEWADKPSPALGGKTPRHAAAFPDGRRKVADLIDQMERHEPARRRLDRAAYDYHRLRSQVGL